MALQIVDLFGYPVSDHSELAEKFRHDQLCPFTERQCIKQFRDGTVSGVCTVKQSKGDSVICCPNRLYADNYKALLDVAVLSFGSGVRLIPASAVKTTVHDGLNVAVFGKRWGKELRLPGRAGGAGFFVDWVLAHIDENRGLAQFVAVEVQSIDTTGTYRPEWNARMRGEAAPPPSAAGLNWENVSKRILPQLIYKGHILRRERLCSKGLFFVCPEAVYCRIQARLGNALLTYPQPAHGTLTFLRYERVGGSEPGKINPLRLLQPFTTTVDQLALALSAPRDLPDEGVYEQAIRSALRNE